MESSELVEQVNRNFDRLSGQVKQGQDVVKEKLAGQDARLNELEQKLARRGGAGSIETTELRVTQIAKGIKESTALKDFRSGAAKEARILLSDFGAKAVVSDGATPSIVPAPQYRPGIQAPLFEAPTIESMLPHVPMTTGSVQWTREKTGADWTGAVQAKQGDAKKQASVTFENISANASTVAVYIKAAEQALDDVQGLAAYIEQRLRDGIAVGTEAQILNGTGTNGQMSGMLLPANHVNLSTTGLTSPTGFDLLRRARTQIRNAFGAANAVMLHPNDAEALDLIKDSEGRYILGGPAGGAGGALWRMQPVETTAIAEGTFVALDTVRSATIYDRQELVLTIDREEDDLTRNMITIRAEVRKTLAVTRPSLIVVGSFEAEA